MPGLRPPSAPGPAESGRTPFPATPPWGGCVPGFLPGPLGLDFGFCKSQAGLATDFSQTWCSGVGETQGKPFPHTRACTHGQVGSDRLSAICKAVVSTRRSLSISLFFCNQEKNMSTPPHMCTHTTHTHMHAHAHAGGSGQEKSPVARSVPSFTDGTGKCGEVNGQVQTGASGDLWGHRAPQNNPTLPWFPEAAV